MKKFFQKIGFIFLIVIVAFFTFLFITFWKNPWKNKRQANKEFMKNIETFCIINDYFTLREYENLYYPSKEDGKLFAGLEDGYISVNNDDAKKAMDLLISRGYKDISKKGNCISFLRWSNKDNGSGFIYSLDGHIPDESSLQFLTKLEPLTEDRWYYYEEDFNEWKIRNQN